MIAALPPVPDALSRGVCLVPGQLDLWTSTDRGERFEARALCRQCPAVAPCLEWSLSLPKGDTSVLGGLFPSARNELRRERARALAAERGQAGTVA